MNRSDRCRRPAVAVCGPGALGDRDHGLAQAAERVGEGLAEAGVVLVCGGLGGAMEGAARGAQAARSRGADGIVVGIVPGENADSANSYCDVVIPTGMGIGRNVLIARCADVVIAIGGRSGTLSEMALAWQLGKPVVALAPHGGWASSLAGERIDDRRSDRVQAADTPEDAVRLALESLGLKSLGPLGVDPVAR